VLRVAGSSDFLPPSKIKHGDFPRTANVGSLQQRWAFLPWPCTAEPSKPGSHRLRSRVVSHTMPLRCPRLHDSLPRQGHTLRGAPFGARLPQAQTAPARNVQAFLLIVHLLTEPSCIFQSTLAVLILEALPHTTSSYRTEYLSSPVNQRCVTAMPAARCVPRTQMRMLVLMLLLLDAAFRSIMQPRAACCMHRPRAPLSLLSGCGV
jgi:hypothetical protein